MKKDYLINYEAPQITVFSTEVLAPLATSGTHEGFVIEDDEEGLI